MKYLLLFILLFVSSLTYGYKIKAVGYAKARIINKTNFISTNNIVNNVYQNVNYSVAYVYKDNVLVEVIF